MEFAEKHWPWLVAGAVGLLIALRSLKVSGTNGTGESSTGAGTKDPTGRPLVGSLIVNPSISNLHPFVGAGTLSLAGISGFVPNSVASVQETENGVTYTGVGVSTEQGVQAGAQSGAIALNTFSRNAAIAAGANSYEFIDPTTGISSTMWINTASVFYFSSDTEQHVLTAGDVSSQAWYWATAADPTAQNDSPTPLPIDNLGWVAATVNSLNKAYPIGSSAPPPFGYGGPSPKGQRGGYGADSSVQNEVSQWLPPQFTNYAQAGQVPVASLGNGIGFPLLGASSTPINYPA